MDKSLLLNDENNKEFININISNKYISLNDNNKRDLILNNFSYIINDIPDFDANNISNLYNDIKNGFKYLTNNIKHKTKIVLNGIDLVFPSGSSTIVFF